MEEKNELEVLANTLLDIDTCQRWETEAIDEAAKIIRDLSQLDPDDIAKQADAYVRDHLLIQYMMWKFGKACMLDIEDIYDEWIKWLEEKE